MANDAQLAVSIVGSIKSLENSLKRAGLALDSFDGEADRKTKRTARKISDNLANAVNDNAVLRLDQWQNLGFQMNDVLTGLASGQKPMQVMAQQGGQIYQVLAGANGGVTGALKEIGQRAVGLATPFALAAAAVTATAAAAYLLGTRWSDAQDKIQLGLTGIGKTSGATVKDINDIAFAMADAGRMSASAARDIATALASTGRIGKGQIGAITGLAPGFMKIFGVDAAKAGEELARMFSDPSKGADEFNARLGSLDDRTRQYIRTLDAQGDRQGAILALVQNVQAPLDEAAKKTGIWTRAWNSMADAADRAGAAIQRATAPTLDQKMDILQSGLRLAQGGDQREAVEAAKRRGVPDEEIWQFAPSYDPQMVRVYQREIDILRLKMEAVAAVEKERAKTVATNQMSIQAGEIVRQYDAAGEAIKKVENDIKALESALADGSVIAKIDGGPARAAEALESYRTKLAQLKKDYAEGGAAAASALRQAQFQERTAGLSSYERGLREITQRFNDMREAARRAGQVDALPKIDATERAAIGAYRIQSGERARSQVIVPSDYAQQVIGAESSGRDWVKNPNSSATGAGQFTRGTWLSLFRKTFSDVAAEMTDEAILGLRTNREYSVKLIEAYARENALALNRAGFEATNANLHLAHFLGPGGAAKALRANPSDLAANVLDADQVAANPTILGNGKTIADVLAYAQRRAAANGVAARSVREATIAEQQNTEAIGKSAAEAARLAAINEQLNASRQAGGELGQRFATAEALIKASSDQLTPALAAQREEVLRLADARAKASSAGLSAQFDRDLKDQYAALGRTATEQQVYQQAKQYATPGTAEFDKATDALQRLKDVSATKDTAGSFLKGLASDLMSGTKASEALTNQLKRLASTLADKAIDSLLSGLFDTGGKSSGGLIGSIVKQFTGSATGKASGGWIAGPGGPRSDSIPAMLSNGEYVVNAAAAARHGALLEAINGGRLSRFANGGFVGPAIPRVMAPAAVRAPSVQINNYTGEPVQARSDGNGGMQIDVGRMVDGALAERIAGGRGLTSRAITARATRADLRG